MKKAKISHNVITRLPRYLRYLAELKTGGVVRISSGELGQLMGITASQIRQDFSCFGEFGQQGYGYNVEMLMKAINDILGINKERTAVIVGPGNLGHALITNFPFHICGVKLSAIFDVSKDTIGTKIRGIEVYAEDTLENYISDNNIDIAILTMPGKFANTVAGKLIDAGIKGIWNFTNVDLKLKNSNVAVENIHFSDSLLILNYYLSRKNDLDVSEEQAVL